MNLLILKGFNNYFNRIIKRYSTKAEYIAHSGSYYDFSNINFNPNDGVTTTQVLGSSTQQQAGGPDLVPLAWEHDGNPDYLIAYETEQVGIATNTVIRSRWFITESVRTRNGQYSLKLKRDSIADHLETLLSCPAFIKKGTVSDDNPLIVNSEGITVNQIKSGETLLKDKTGSAWIVGYLSKDFVDKSDPDNPISVQVPDGDYESITIEDLAAELDISPTVLENILVTDPDNQVRFVNDNINIFGYVNLVDNSSNEYVLRATSSNFLAGFSSSWASNIDHPNFNDCFCKTRGWSNTLSKNDCERLWKKVWNDDAGLLKTNWSAFTNGPFLTKKVYEKLVDLSKNHTLIYKAGLYYQIAIGNASVADTHEKYTMSTASGFVRNICQNFVTAYNETEWYADGKLDMRDSGVLTLRFNELTANIYLTNKIVGAQIPTVSVNISTSRNAISNQPFDMFAMPFNDTILVNGNDEYELIGDYAQRLAIALMAVETKGQIYDLQLLPYCPIPEIANNNTIDITGQTEHYDYDLILKSLSTETFVSDAVTPEYDAVFNEYDASWENLQKPEGTGTLTNADINVIYTNENHTSQSIIVSNQTSSSVNIIVSFELIDPDGEVPKVIVSWNYTPTNPVVKSLIIYPKNNSFSVALDYNLTLKESMKIDSQTDLYRLVSPNYQGSFDFNVAKNGGVVNGFIADCTYKPYTPYIKVAPNFAWLYGTNYGDCRGLICGGDFSIGFYSDIWQEYQLQNKNYQNIFNREIQNLDVNQYIQRKQQYISGGLNIVRDAIAGGVGGGLATGSPYGAIAGAVVGGIGSGIGYGIDMNLMEKSLQEQRQFSIDKFQMQLNNIQALPYTLTKVGAFNINSKIWPFLEYYTCSEQEKEALKMKIQYEGMTVGIVDYLGNYMSGGYVQADLIRNESIIEDSHLLDDIYIELTKGVYM